MAGAFFRSTELRAYAANTIGSADIVDNCIQSVDINDGEVENADLGANAVSTSKIKDGAVKSADVGNEGVRSVDIADGTLSYADFSRSSVVVEHRSDCDYGGTGWDLSLVFNVQAIADEAVTDNSVASTT